MLLGVSSKSIASSMAQLLTAASQGDGNGAGTAARDTVNALKVLTQAVRGMAAANDDKKQQDVIIESAIFVMDKAVRLIEEARKAVSNPKNEETYQGLENACANVSIALRKCVLCLPGIREIENAIKTITSLKVDIQETKKTKPFTEVLSQLNRAALSVNISGGETVRGLTGAMQNVGSLVSAFKKNVTDFVAIGVDVGGYIKDSETRSDLRRGLKMVCVMSAKLLMASKSLLIGSHGMDASVLLTKSVENLTQSTSDVVTICSTSGPGQKECEEAHGQIQAMKTVMVNPLVPVSEQTYSDCKNGIMAKAKSLGETIAAIGSYSKTGDVEKFCTSMREFTEAVGGLSQHATQAAYLAGVEDADSKEGKVAIIDVKMCIRAKEAVEKACPVIIGPSSTNKQVLSASAVIVKYMSALCNACKQAASKTKNPAAKKQFAQYGRDVANATANLVWAIKPVYNHPNPHLRQSCDVAGKKLIKVLESLVTFVSVPEFAGFPAKLSDKAKSSQSSITKASMEFVEGSCDLMQAAKQLAANPKDTTTYHQYSGQSASVSEAIKRLIEAVQKSAGSDWVDPDDPAVIAETELLAAAKSIEAAAMKLEQLMPRKRPKSVNENLQFDEQILEAAKSITAAVGALLKTATIAQRELVAEGKVQDPYGTQAEQDTQWSQGLISAAKMVAVAVNNLCDAANAMVQGTGTEEKLISAAKQVESYTLQLVMACQVKADKNSGAMKRLKEAANAVKDATRMLVRAAQRGIDDKMMDVQQKELEAREAVLSKENAVKKAQRELELIQEAKSREKGEAVGLQRKEINAKERVTKCEAELDTARRELEQLRRDKYKK